MVLRDFFRYIEERVAAVGGAGGVDEHETDHQLATAALLVEVMRADYRIDAVERRAVVDAVARAFELDGEHATELARRAQERSEQATSLYEFTSLVHTHYSEPQKERIVELMWDVALADGDIDKYEEHLIRRVAELLYVPHMHFMRAKHRALARAGHSDTDESAQAWAPAGTGSN